MMVSVMTEAMTRCRVKWKRDLRGGKQRETSFLAPGNSHGFVILLNLSYALLEYSQYPDSSLLVLGQEGAKPQNPCETWQMDVGSDLGFLQIPDR
jgi:hypothetical protein